MTEQISTILITVLTVGGGAGAWKFYEFLIKNKREKNKEKFDDSNLYRDDLRARVEKLEDEKTNLMNRLTNLSSELSAIKVKLEFIEKENDRLLRR
jgi:predicted nuclease with TOPRIM domain|tara:strand:+ start:2059 stop:2346 length:288 start_codon:yes stop_codon:yes gene_type:complete